MRETRELFWNVGQGSVPLMYLLSLAAVAVMVQGFRRLFGAWRLGRPLDRFDRSRERISRFLSETMTQRRVLRVPDGGLLHSGLFWGFITMFVGTILVMFQADLLSPVFQVNMLSGLFYRIFSLVLDLAGITALLALAGLFVRRYFIRPDGLETTQEDGLVHALLLCILLTGFLIEGSRMAVTEVRDNPALALWSPAGLLASRLFASMGDEAVAGLHRGLWWLHLLLGLGFIALIPRTKLRHLFTTSGNSYFAPLEGQGELATIDLEDDTVDRFGATLASDLTWKDLFDTDACTACKRCQDRCPAWVTGKPLSPMKVIRQIGRSASESPSKSLIDAVTREALWACTTCGACQEICPADIEHVVKIVEMRRSLTLMEGEFAGEEVRKATSAIEVTGNPFGMAPASRGAWAEGLPVSVMADDSRVDLLYFAGCYASFDPRNRKVAESFVRICAAAGIRVGILGAEERCCGEPVRMMGNEYLYQMTARQNIAAIGKYGVTRIVTACPHCFTTLDRGWRNLGLEIPVEHHSTFIAGLVGRRQLKLAPEPFGFTWHDPCYLGRHNGIYTEPRSLLKAAGGKLSEMEASGPDSFCCGAGGGRILAEERTGRRINSERVRMARNSGAGTLVSGCPFCLSMFEDGMAAAGSGSGMKAFDLAEIVAARIGG
ncbi:MAG: 4Fe-4S dicluster domain-containing protein [Chlorobiaceae bacterium]|nr:4Fe-4S dicluster domain-containing protein [Chlorobiaceae bacterium]